MTTIIEGIRAMLVEACRGDQILGTATAFLVPTKTGIGLLTNRHVVTGRHQVTGQPLHKQGGLPDTLKVNFTHIFAEDRWGWSEEFFPLLDADEMPVWIEHPRLGASADMALLHLPDQLAGRVNQQLLFDPNDAGLPIRCMPMDMVSIIGFPFGKTSSGKEAIWSTGFLATDVKLEFDGLPTFLVDSRSRSGQSGSPVVAYRNGGVVLWEDGTGGIGGPFASRFLGIYSGRIHPDSDLGVVWNIGAISELIASA